MKIAFVGNSLTKGIPGIGYVGVIKRKEPSWEILNYGKGGDSVASLLQRIKKIRFPEELDHIVLEIGVNDVYVKVSKVQSVLRTLLNQPWSSSVADFENSYREVLSVLMDKAKSLIVVTPVLMGELVDNGWNDELKQLSDLIEKLVSPYDKVRLVKAGELFTEHLKVLSPSSYILLNPFSVVSDALFLRTRKAVDRKAEKRGLFYTLDGVHLNGTGAEMLSDELISAINQHNG